MKPLLLAFLAATAAHATVKLPAIFSDHAVLQRQASVPVWGWAEKGEEVSVSIAGQTVKATAGDDGKWMAKLANLEAGGPHTLTITGSSTIVINDVLVGEVWLGSGQSNMAMQVGRAMELEKSKAMANTPQIRHFAEASGGADTPQSEGKGAWVVCAPETVERFSATAYFFGREIHRELKVPVGLINSSVGGTPIESWIAGDKQRALPALKGFFANKPEAPFDAEAAKAKYEKDLAAWKEVAKAARAAKKPAPRAPQDPIALRAKKGNIGGLFNGKIAPLIPYAIRGALWYQGEANTSADKPPYYEHQLALLVTDWRAKWGYEFPFAWAQLPNFIRPGEGWPAVREAMMKTLRLPKTGMGINIDIGMPNNIHPTNKQEVGRRLSLWALGTVYGQKVTETSGPLFSKHEVRGKDIVLSFTHGEGLKAKDGAALKHFVIAGADKQWKDAQARIDGGNVIVSSAEVAAPAAVRYCWLDNPEATLFNAAGLPASPFRTDDWAIDFAIAPASRAAKPRAAAAPASTAIRVACIGDSITAGSGAKDRRIGPYPAQLQVLLGSGYKVQNFGVGGATMGRTGDKPYDKQAAYKAALAFKPQLVVIKLGTNDSKAHNWAKKDDFLPSAKALLAAVRESNPEAKIWLCLPAPCFPGNFGITDAVVSEGIIPALKQLAEEEKLTTIDLYAALKTHGDYFPDKVHPNDNGYRIIAAVIAKALTGKEPPLDLLPTLEK